MGAAWRGLVALWPRLAITLICLAFWRILAAIPLPVAGLVDLRLSSGRLVADGGLSNQQALIYWSAFSPLPLVVIGYHVMFSIVIVLPASSRRL